MSRREIPRKIDAQEILVRLIKSPIHFDPKKNKLSSAAFTPSSKAEGTLVISGKTLSIPGVSLMRLAYTDANTCKEHAVNITNPDAVRPESFAGLLIFTSNQLEEVCSDEAASALESKKIIESDPVVVVHGTPMDDSNPNQYIAPEVVVYTDTPGLPMHADLIYNFPRPEKGIPNNPINMLAKAILEKASHKYDPSLDPKVWEGDALEIEAEK